HQPASQPMDALVGDERRLANLRAGAELPRLRAELALRDSEERALEDPVVVAGRAARAARDEGLADVPVVVRQRPGADRVGDPVAVALDRPGRLDVLVELVERRLRAVVVRNVRERLLVAV